MSEKEFITLCLTLVALVAMANDKDKIILKALSTSLVESKKDVISTISKLFKRDRNNHSKQVSRHTKRKRKAS